MPEVVAALLTRNRVELLRQAIQAVLTQERPVDGVIVVDNASTDGTPEMIAAEFPQVKLVALSENQGATGGFYEAIRAGLETGADWVWLLDDDSFARPAALAKLLEALRRLDGGAADGGSRPAVLSSRVEWKDGGLHPMNLPVVRPDDGEEFRDALRHGLLPIRAASWVSLMLSREAIERSGMPLRQFFYQADDIEYTARILRDARGYYVPHSVVEHSTATKHTAVDDDHRFFYHVRNTLLMIRGRAWERREKAGLWAVLITTTFRYVRKNRRRPASFRNLLGAIAAGLRTPAD